MDPLLHSNGSNTSSAIPARPPAAGSRAAGRLDRVLYAAVNGDPSAVLDVTTPDLLAAPKTVARSISAVLDRPGSGLAAHMRIDALLRRSNLHDGLLDALGSDDPSTRAGAARICGAARLTESVLWISDLVHDEIPRVSDAAVRSLGRLGGRRAVEELMSSSDIIPLHRLAIALSKAASDIDIEALMRRPASEEAAVATVLASGLRRDVLRVPPLLGIAHDQRWPKHVRMAACKALAMIGDRSAADGLHRLAERDPDTDIQKAAERAHRRLLRRVVRAKP